MPRSSRCYGTHFETELAPAAKPDYLPGGAGSDEERTNERRGEGQRVVTSLGDSILDALVKLMTNFDSKAPSWPTERRLGSVKTYGGEMEPIVISPLSPTPPVAMGYNMVIFE